MVAAALDRFGRIDIFLANAGIYVPGDVADGDPGRLGGDDRGQRLQRLPRHPRRPARHDRAHARGHIVVTSSISGHAALHWEPVYSATKHAIQSFVHGLRRQVAPHGLRVGEVSPGIVLNELWGYTDPAAIAEQRPTPTRASSPRMSPTPSASC